MDKKYENILYCALVYTRTHISILYCMSGNEFESLAPAYVKSLACIHIWVNAPGGSCIHIYGLCCWVPIGLFLGLLYTVLYVYPVFTDIFIHLWPCIGYYCKKCTFSHVNMCNILKNVHVVSLVFCILEY